MSEPTTLGRAMAEIRASIVVDQPDPEQELGPDGAPYCETCKGLRYLRLDVPVTDPMFGKLMRCTQCPPEVGNARRNELAQFTGMGEAQMGKTFATFQARRGTEKALKAAREWAAQPKGWLVIHGTPDRKTGRQRLGQGKTHLACAVANELLDHLQSVHWWYAPDAVAAYQAAFATHEHGEVLKRFQEAKILILDDLGAARGTESAIQQFLEPLMNYRERNRMPTLVTCIGDPNAIKEKFSESIGRRMQDAHLCKVVSIDAEQYQADSDTLPF